MKMKAAIYYSPGDIRIEEIERPHASPEGVVVKVKDCGVCNIIDADAWARRRTSGRSGTGLARGHEWSGEVVEVGAEVTDFKVGDRIYQNPVFRPCYECPSCLVKDYWRCINWRDGLSDVAIHGAMAEYMGIPFVTKESAAKLPDTLNFRDLALIEPVYLGVGLARKARAGDVVVVLGQEVIGLTTVVKLKEKGVAKIITADISQMRIKASKAAGADVVIDSLKDDVVREVMNETAGEGADIVILADRRPVALMQAISCVKTTGILWTATMYYSIFRLDPAIAKRDMSTWIGPGAGVTDTHISFDPSLLTMQCAWGSLGPRVPRLHEAAELLQSGKISAKKFVTKVFPLEKSTEAFDLAMDHHKSIKVLIEP